MMTRWTFLTRIGKGVIVAAGVVFLGTLMSGPSLAAEYKEEETRVLLSRLKDSKHSLVDGISQAEKAYGIAISAKFEMKGENLMLSVYTAKEGRNKDAEHNVLMELLGDATKPTWEPEIEVFEDKPHIARSAMHLTLMQVTKLALVEVIKKAAAVQPGTVYSVIPAVRDGKPIFGVLVATPDGKSVPLTLDLRTGKVIK
ncbi:MAG: PepSY domain-containing protein [candidate division NC10 bacterium]|nr:PepSY domain-containing protein [candidate division NC10 bacterium]